MLHQDTTRRFDARGGFDVRSSPSIAVLAYRSRANVPMDEAALDLILSLAQKRNRAEGVTGVLVYDKGCFLQWLEGPPQALARVWSSISRDPRHGEIEVLRQGALPERFFDNWDLRLARSKTGDVSNLSVAIEAPQQLMQQLRRKPAVLADTRWHELFEDVVIPKLRTVHAASVLPAEVAAVPRPLGPAIWHAAEGASAALARNLLAADSSVVAHDMDLLLAQGAWVNALYGEVIEPAQRYLGDLWSHDECNDFELTLALARMQVEVRRLGAESPAVANAFPDASSILLATLPGELHGVGVALSSEVFFRDGWDVTCEFPNNDQGVCDLVRDRWFDVLELSLSGALRRDYHLPFMRSTIRAARLASVNPSLTVLVDGRVFFDKPRAYLEVAADGASPSAVDGVRVARRLLAGGSLPGEGTLIATRAAPAGPNRLGPAGFQVERMLHAK
jgi:hypothetical protein